MESLNLLSCPNCNEQFTEVYMLPCMHNFCSKCTNLMKNEAETTCLICSNSCHQDEVKQNTFLEKICLIELQNKKSQIEIIICELCEKLADKFCIECSQYICLECSTRHVKSKNSKDHKIVDKDNVENLVIKSPEPICEKHETKFTIYCKSCDSIMCATCCHMDLLHSNHYKSDNLKEVYFKSNSDIKKKIIEIDGMIKDQNQLIEENKILETNFFKNCDNIQCEIESFAKELKNKIDNLTNVNVDRIISIKNDFIKSVQFKLKEITDYISSLTNFKSYFQEVINKGSNVDVFKLRKELNKNTWIEMKKPKLIPIIKLSFQKTDIDLSKSFKLLEINDLTIMLKESTGSACVFKQNIYTVNNIDNCIDIYDIETGKNQSFIDYKQCLRKDSIIYVFIVNTLEDLFFYHYYNSNKNTLIFKLKDNKIFFKIKKLKYESRITSTFQQTLLVRTTINILIELSANGDELKRISIPGAIFSSLFSNPVHQLKDERYVMTSYGNSVQMSLLDLQGNLIKSFTLPTTSLIRTCTDGEKFIFVFDYYNEKITVLSTDLQILHQLHCPEVVNIYFDQVNDKLLLVKDKEIIYITSRIGMLFSI